MEIQLSTRRENVLHPADMLKQHAFFECDQVKRSDITPEQFFKAWRHGHSERFIRCSCWRLQPRNLPRRRGQSSSRPGRQCDRSGTWKKIQHLEPQDACSQWPASSRWSLHALEERQSYKKCGFESVNIFACISYTLRSRFRHIDFKVGSGFQFVASP